MLGLSSGVELPEVQNVPGILDGYPILCLQAWRRVPRDAGRDTYPERLEHPAPPEVLPMKQGPEPVKQGPEPVKKGPEAVKKARRL